MNSEHRGDIKTGFNQRKQLEAAVETAQKTTGMATRQNSSTLLKSAYQSIEDARQLSQEEELSELDQDFLNQQLAILNDCQHQLDEAQH
ncbi:DUF2564 family protein [Bacillus swezeyi]|uniref:DUF2564 family protein n=1 Tax=Bacillus swezeyi TaxID=1925020 RepID=A0A5M8S0W3_9BACI|nr:DUF2564 family protein [Bacillus swezeyi]KAA6451742.1 DUF2564 family protein [Bacillus swezeyi]KAA6482548.1 DUF2564 family protein [Bacillus swezeyi]TYS35966.1 DUF2564 family protein [Bacillus swezeyi]